MIFSHPVLEALVIKVNAKHVNRRSSAMPDVDKMSQRSARRIFPWLSAATVERNIHIHRNVIDGASSRCNLLNIFGIGPSLENLFGIHVVAKHLCPRLAFPYRLEFFADIRMKRLFVLVQIVGQ